MKITKTANASANVDDVEIRIQRYAFPPYTDDYFVIVLQYQFSFILLLSFVVVAPNITKDVCLEKEKKLKVYLFSNVFI
jgi:hypothetical protein